MPQNRDPALYCIHRADKATASPGWRVTISRSKQRFARRFCDSTYGGSAAALRAAKRWRNEIVEQYPPMRKNVYNNLVRASNTSGIVGVRMHHTRADTYWAAQTFLPDGRRLRKFFNIRTLGHDRAKQLAIAERNRQLAEVRGVFIGNAPTVIVKRLSRHTEKG